MPYRTQSPDTSPAAEPILVEAWRAMDPLAKIARANDLTWAARELAMAGIRSRHPDADPRELRLRLLSLLLDRDAMLQFFGWDPQVQGRG